MSASTKDKLMEDLKQVINDAEALTKETAGDLSGRAKEVRDKLAVRIKDAKGQISQLESVAKERAAEGVKETDRVIREHPYESLGISFGLGILVGVLLNRK
ncbi:MAG: DUF883 family protein [Verrucomicrobiota bacterium]